MIVRTMAMIAALAAAASAAALEVEGVRLADKEVRRKRSNERSERVLGRSGDAGSGARALCAQRGLESLEAALFGRPMAEVEILDVLTARQLVGAA